MDTTSLQRELHPRRLLPNLTAGLIGGTLNVILATSFAALIFSGDLADRVGNGIGLALFGAFAISLVVALTSSFPSTLAGPQDSPAAILALAAATIARSTPASATADATLQTIVATIAAASLLTGVFFWTLGRFRLGSLVRFVPYPVVGGFLAGTGWLLAQGGFGVMTGASLSSSQLADLLQPDVLLLWLPGSVFAVVLLLLMRRYSHFLIMPGMLLLALLLFYASLWATNTSVAEASARGWLLGPFPQAGLWQPLTPSALAQVNWPAIVGQMGQLGTVVMISVVSLLLNASGLELAVRQDIDLNRELQSAGVANLVAGLGGGLVGYHYLGDTVLVHKMGARSRLAGLFAAALCGVALLVGASVLSFFPRTVLGALLLFLGLSFLVEWVYDAWFKLPRTDYVLVLTILVIVGAAGFLQGVGAGIGIAVILFVVKYSRINVVKHTLSGASFRSRVDRSIAQREILRDRGEQLHILQLQGFIFFGTAQNLLNQIRQRSRDSHLQPLRFVVLDFLRVSGFDSSAMSSFIRMKQLAEVQGIRLIFTRLSPDMQRQLEQNGLADGRDEVFRVLPTLDYGMEWCEERILEAEGVLLAETQNGLPAQLEKIFPKSANVARFMDYLEKQEVGAGYCIVRQNDPSDALYFFESGSATAQFELDDGRTIRLRAMRGGTVVGEVGLYLGGVRTASVVTTQPSTLYRLSASAIQQMEEKDPEEAAALHRLIAYLMAIRLAENNTVLANVLD